MPKKDCKKMKPLKQKQPQQKQPQQKQPQQKQQKQHHLKSSDDDDDDDDYETMDDEDEDDDDDDDSETICDDEYNSCEEDDESYESSFIDDDDIEEEEEDTDDSSDDSLAKGKKYNTRSKGNYNFILSINSKRKRTDKKKIEEEENEDESVSSVESKQKRPKATKEDAVPEAVPEEELLSKFTDLYNKTKSRKIVEDCISRLEDAIKEEDKKRQRKQRKQADKYARIFQSLLRQSRSTNDLKYFQTLEGEKQLQLIKELRAINNEIYIKTPYRIRLLNLDIPAPFKIAAMKKVGMLKSMDSGSGEYHKLKGWVDGFMQIPFNNFHKLPVTIQDGTEKCDEFISQSKRILDDAVFGLENAKIQIIQWLGQVITNPNSIGTSIAIQGPPGTGKTSLVKEGISKILNRPFAFIALGGATDSSVLDGHCYTYEGSTYGKIVQILIQSKCMNPIIYFDELDKISDTPKGEEITGILTHLTDTTQNSQFHDKFFSELHFDLRQCLFIFSFNDVTKVNPILLDRMYRIITKGFDQKQKTSIAINYILPKMKSHVQFQEDDLVFPEDTIQYILSSFAAKEDGVRNLKRCIESIVTKLNLFRLLKPTNTILQNDFKIDSIAFPLTVTKEIVDKLLKRDDSFYATSHLSMYI
jgi:ATP-dependent Lon protease